MRVIIFLLILCQVTPAWTCSVFSLRQGETVYVAKNFDFQFGQGLVFRNLRGIQKTSLVRSTAQPVQWTSRYGSITFNQIARDFPYGGLNERGLNIEILWLNETVYPRATSGDVNAVNESQWIQYMLDRAASVAEVVQLSETLLVASIFAKVHYFVCDTSGACATFEYLNGQLAVARSTDSLRKPVLLNSPSTETQDVVQRQVNDPRGRYSADEMSQVLAPLPEENTPQEIFRRLELIRQGNFTVWQIVYNLNNGEIFFRTTQSTAVKSFNLNDADFACTGDEDESFIDIQTAEGRRLAAHDWATFTRQVDHDLLSQYTVVPRGTRLMGLAFAHSHHQCVGGVE